MSLNNAKLKLRLTKSWLQQYFIRSAKYMHTMSTVLSWISYKDLFHSLQVLESTNVLDLEDLQFTQGLSSHGEQAMSAAGGIIS